MTDSSEDDKELLPNNVFNQEGFEFLISQLAETYYFGQNDFEGEQELLNVWIKIGQLLNVFHVLPHHKLIVNSEEGQTKILAYILCASKKVLEQITDHDIFDQDMVEQSVKAIEDKKKGYN
jgi:hypothetical protein